MALPSPLPERNIFRLVTGQCLRHFAAFTMEANMVNEHTAILGDRFWRAEEGSPFDAGIIIGDDVTDGFVGMEAKTLVVSCRQESHINTIRGPSWVGKIPYQEGQLNCDIWSVYFPLLRQPNVWRAIVNPRAPDFVPASAKHYILYWHAETGQKIDHVVPAGLWPSMGKVAQSVSVVTAMCAKDSEKEGAPVPDLSFDLKARKSRPTRLKSLQNPQARRENALVELIRAQLAALESPQFEVIRPLYSPYTADFAFRHPQSGKMAFVELKMGYCRIEEDSKHPNELVVYHNYAHPNRGGPIFTQSSGRWTYLITTCSRVGAGSKDTNRFPEEALLWHRSDITESWWYAVPAAGEVLVGMVSKQALINLGSKDLASQVEAVLLSHLAKSRFCLPELESFEKVSHSQLSQVYKRAADYATTIEIRSAEKRPKSYRPNYAYQAVEALSFLGACQEAREGVLFDWQHKHLGLRSYAFSPYSWTITDVVYNAERPRRTPVGIYELAESQQFLLLNFCLFRQDETDGEIYVHPFILPDLYHGEQGAHFASGRRILVMMTEDITRDPLLDPPLLAVPDNAIQCDLPLPHNWTRWVRLQFKPGEDRERFWIDNRKELVRSLANAMRNGLVGSPDSSMVRFADHSLRVTSRSGLYAQIQRLGERTNGEVESDADFSDDESTGMESTKHCDVGRDWTLF